MNNSYFFNLPAHKNKTNIAYTYNFYEENETSREENIIKSSDSLNSSFVNISINYFENLTEEKIAFLTNTDLEGIYDLLNTNGDENYYNFIKEYQYDYEKVKLIKNSGDLKKIIRESLDTSEGGLTISDDFIKDISLSSTAFINNKFSGLIFENIQNSVFGNSFDLEKTRENDNNKIEKENITNNISNFTLGLVPFKQTSSYTNTKKSITNIGFLVEKHLSGRKISSKFFLNEILTAREDPARNNAKKTIVKDYHVNYGKDYKYIIYPVFYGVCCKENDYHINNHFLICGKPSIERIICEEKERPAAPQSLRLKYYDKKDALIVSWSKPENIQNDIKGYHIYRRKSLTEPYQMIGVIDFSVDTDFYTPSNDERISSNIIQRFKKNIMKFEDKTFSKNEVNIYAVVAFDAHGMFSNYSDQISVLFNNVKKSLMIDLISLKGAPLHLPNLFVLKNTKFFNNYDKIETILPIAKNKTKLTLMVAPDFVSFKNLDSSIESTLKENYIFKVFKLENHSEFVDEIKIKNFTS
jgi:hypothetical protein